MSGRRQAVLLTRRWKRSAACDKRDGRDGRYAIAPDSARLVMVDAEGRW